MRQWPSSPIGTSRRGLLANAPALTGIRLGITAAGPFPIFTGFPFQSGSAPEHQAVASSWPLSRESPPKCQALSPVDNKLRHTREPLRPWVICDDSNGAKANDREQFSRPWATPVRRPPVCGRPVRLTGLVGLVRGAYQPQTEVCSQPHPIQLHPTGNPIGCQWLDHEGSRVHVDVHVKKTVADRGFFMPETGAASRF